VQVSSLQGSQENKAKTTIFEACFIFAYFSSSDPESDVTSYDVAWGT